MNNLTIAYITSRKHPAYWWFISSLRKQCTELGISPKVVAVDFWGQPLPQYFWTEKEIAQRRSSFRSMSLGFQFVYATPKPTPWQGPHKLTKKDYFAPSNARNTALCYAPDGWIAYVDDVSVLLPTWLTAVLEAMKKNYIACGAFRKVKNLIVDEGEVKSFDDHAAGWDSRWKGGNDKEASPCAPNWLFGCSAALPISALLKINGWPEAVCDSTGVGAEDCFTGMALAVMGHHLRYDRRMLTFESEELHHDGVKMARDDKGVIGTPDSKSHAAVRMLQNAKYFNNCFDPYPDLAALRQHILKGGDFPIPKTPQHDWYNGEPLSKL